MGFFQRLFSNSPQARMERAEIFISKGRLNDARIELEGLNEPKAKAAYDEVIGILAKKNLDEAQARFSSGDYQGAQDHLELAKNFGATNEEIRQIRQSGNQLKKERKRNKKHDKTNPKTSKHEKRKATHRDNWDKTRLHLCSESISNVLNGLTWLEMEVLSPSTKPVTSARDFQTKKYRKHGDKLGTTCA